MLLNGLLTRNISDGKSPVNNPSRRRKRAYSVRGVSLRKKLRFEKKKVGDVERFV
jgi:hypothetical protein